MASGPKRLTLALYRSLLRKCSAFSRLQIQTPIGQMLCLQAKTDLRNWGTHSYLTKDLEERMLKEILPAAAHNFLPRSVVIDSREPVDIVKKVFRAQVAEQNPDKIRDLQEEAFEALQSLDHQHQLMKTTSLTETRGIWVMATSEEVPQPEFNTLIQEDGYTFTYKIRIENRSQDTVKLIGRFWHIEDADGEVITVPKGSPGVVGEMPVLKPGECFRYQSGTDMKTATGFIHGSFQMVIIDENSIPNDEEQELDRHKHFDAIVSRFDLIADGVEDTG